MNKPKRKLLIVDDIEINRLMLRDLFEKDFHVLEADGGKQAISMVKQHAGELAVVLLDLIMPDISGFDVLRFMRAQNITASLPVILITGESGDDTTLEGYELGVSDLINKPFNPDIVQRRVHNVVDLYSHKNFLEEKLDEQREILRNQDKRLKQTNMFLVDALSTAVEFRDNESGGHVRRIRFLTSYFLRLLNDDSLSNEEIEVIAQTSVLHDIGKIAIPDAILQKPGRLDHDEFEQMKNHTISGCGILETLRNIPDQKFFKYSYDICRYHHERWDGRGYPDGLKGEEIPIWAQCASLADVYDALTNDRVYKKAIPHEKAIEMIVNGECGVFNPILIKRFIADEQHLKYQIEQIKKEIPAT